MQTLIRNVRIFDGTGRAPFDGSVLIDGDTIAEISEGESNAVADQVIDGAGRTLMPGMVEGQAHLTWGSSVEKI